MQQRPAEGRRSFLFGLASRLLLVAACETSLAAPLGPGKVPAQVPSVSPGLPLPTASFETWRDGFYAQALATGIAPCTLEVAFKGVTPVPQILALDRRQSEYTRTFSDYLKSAASTARIARGRVLLLKYAELLADIQRRYGVPAQLLVALWAMETDYGTQTGGFPVIAALATLAYDGRRRDFFTTELIEALRIIDSGQAEAANMTGSWAGAMGQPQFMPSVYRRYAQDGDGDGRVDIWNSVADALESTARYLSASGWKPEENWGREVLLPPNFQLSQARLGITIGEPDGMIGIRTRDALQDYQQASGLPADAYPTVELIARIEQEASQSDQERVGRSAGP